jgi:hypothetical protein
MAGILGFFAFGMLGWWVVSLLCLIWLFVAVEKTHWVSITFCIILYVLFLQFLGKLQVFEQAVNHPWEIVLSVLGYFMLGFIWSFVKWWLFVNKAAQKRLEAREKFVRGYQPFESAIPRNVRNHTDENRMADRWEDEVRMNGLEKPTVSKNKGKITTWVLCWPVSFICSLLDDFVRKLVKQLVLKFHKMYDHITNSAFKAVEKAEKPPTSTQPPTRA